MSKRKQVQSSLNTFFGGKQDRETYNDTYMYNACCSSDQGNMKFQESWKEKYK